MRVLVVGDVIVDVRNDARKLGVSAETPTIVAEPASTETTLGGAGLVARALHAVSDDVEVTLMTVGVGPLSCDVGLPAELLRRTRVVLIDGWSVSRKERFFVDGYKLLQLDSLNRGTYDKASREKVTCDLSSMVPRFDAVIACDNRHGVFDEVVARHLVETCEKDNIPLFVDSQVSQRGPNHMWYAGADFFLMNEWELAATYELCRDPRSPSTVGPDSPTCVDRVASELCGCVVVKRGADGAYAYVGSEAFFSRYSCPGVAVDVVDTCGAGDVFMAAFVHKIVDGSALGDALTEACCWGAAMVMTPGTRLPTRESVERCRRILDGGH